MKASRPLVFAILILGVVLSITFMSPAYAVKYQTGVNPGDSAYYTMSGTSTGGATATHANVISVDGSSNVTESFTNYYPGGARFSRFFWIDIFSGASWNFTSNLFFVIGSGLQGGDAIFSGWTNMTVTGPQSGPCGGTARQVDAMGYFRNSQVVQAHWDKSTGILCDYQAADYSGVVALALIMTNTTIWTSSSGSDVFTAAVEITSFLGVPLLILIIFVYVRRRRRRR